ncbi:MAG: hypothetical protein INH41_12080 [Myxococcaceae bacterium]|nr:hypothetical protein [Myxococcaceae bacterium]MCA3013123.1 hypothetical protein [Myxococcaceae bacterium]
MRALLFSTLIAVVGCDSYLAPPVGCPVRRFVNLRQTVTQTVANRPCAFAATPFAVSYSPRFDRTLLGPDGQPQYGVDDDARLIGTRVRVSSAVGATVLCSAPSGECGEGVPEFQTRIGADGRLAYQGRFSLDGFDVVLNGGDQFTWEGVMLTENFGAGNSCDVTATVNVTCAPPMMTGVR